MNIKKVSIVMMISSIIILSCITFLYRNNTDKIKYKGSIVYSLLSDRGNVFFVVNPNNLEEYVKIDFEKYKNQLKESIVSDFVLDKDCMYVVIRNTYNYSIGKIKNGKIEFIPININSKNNLNIMANKDFLVLIDAEKVYFISKNNYKINIVYNKKKINSSVILYKNGVLLCNNDNEMLYVELLNNERLFKLNREFIFTGWYEKDKTLMLYNKNNGETIGVDLFGSKVCEISSNNYFYRGSIDDRSVLLEFMPKGSGGASSFDFELDLIDIIRKEHIYCYGTFIYDIKTHNVKNIGFGRQLTPNQNNWQDIDFNKEMLEKI